MQECSHCKEAAELFDHDLALRTPSACRFHQPAVCLICDTVWNEVTHGKLCPNEGNDFHKGYRKCQADH